MRRLVISPQAQKQIEAAARWWNEHRDKAPEAFEEDVTEAYNALTVTPMMGQQIPSSRGTGLRRVFLPRIRYHIYYRVSEDEIRVVAIWHASRRAPRL